MEKNVRRTAVAGDNTTHTARVSGHYVSLRTAVFPRKYITEWALNVAETTQHNQPTTTKIFYL